MCTYYKNLKIVSEHHRGIYVLWPPRKKFFPVFADFFGGHIKQGNKISIFSLFFTTIPFFSSIFPPLFSFFPSSSPLPFKFYSNKARI